MDTSIDGILLCFIISALASTQGRIAFSNDTKPYLPASNVTHVFTLIASAVVCSKNNAKETEFQFDNADIAGL